MSWPYRESDIDAMTQFIREKNQEALDTIILAAMLTGAPTDEVDTELHRIMGEMPEDVRHWWNAPCTLPGCNHYHPN